MDTKSKSFTNSIVTKCFLFIIFAVATWLTVFFTANLTDNTMYSNVPIDCITQPQLENSDSLRWFEDDLFTTLFYKRDVTQVTQFKEMPTLYFLAEYPDGSTLSNVPAGSGDDFFRSHKIFAIRSTQADGNWREASEHDTSPRRYYSSPNHIYPGRDMLDKIMGYNSSTAVLSAPNTEVTEPSEDRNTVTSKPAAPTEAEVDVEYNISYEEWKENWDGEWTEQYPCPIVKVSYAFDDDSLAVVQQFRHEFRQYFLGQLALIGSLGLVALVCAMWLMIASGRRSGDRELHLLAIDRIPFELSLLLGAGAVTSFVLLCCGGIMQLQYIRLYEDRVIYLSLVSVLTVLAAIALMFCMSYIRIFKSRRFLECTLTFRLLRWLTRPVIKLWDMLRSCFDERAFAGSGLTVSLHRRKLVLTVTVAVAMALSLCCSLMIAGFIFALMLLLCLVIAAIFYWSIKGDQKTYVEINQSMSDSFVEQMKSERTKTALITNVSHDLKTPLTSIITYVDLLQKEELTDTARDYAIILAQKSERLKSMVSDLFDLAKSSSGNIPLDLEVLDLRRLLEQTIADMNDQIEASGLTLKVALPEGEVYIFSDGKKLYRVFQNLIGNALKYSLEGTRVFVSLETADNHASAILRNTAGYEMQFTSEEVLQRFARGDNSRTGEGSGLGLSIAESFTTACGGDFKLDIDGDLFKVTASFPLSSQADAPKTV